MNPIQSACLDHDGQPDEKSRTLGVSGYTFYAFRSTSSPLRGHGYLLCSALCSSVTQVADRGPVCSRVAKEYDAKPWQKKFITQITEDIRTHRDWLGLNELKASDGSLKEQAESARLLDYACGPGTISKV